MTLPPSVLSQILSKPYLEQVRHLSICGRVHRINRDFGTNLGASTLRRIYRNDKVTYIKPSYKFTRKLKDPRLLLIEKVQFCNRVIALLKADKQVICFDETSTHSWEKISKV